MKVQAQTATITPTRTESGTQASAAGFQNLLDSAMQPTTGGTKSAGGAPKDAPKQSTELPASDLTPDDAALAAAAAQAATPVQEPQAEADSVQQPTETTQVVAPAPEAPLTLADEAIPTAEPQQADGGEILSMQVTTAEQEIPTAQQGQAQVQDRFGSMLENAQQELQQIAAGDTPDETQALPEATVPVDEKAQAPETEAPAAPETADEIELPEAAEPHTEAEAEAPTRQSTARADAQPTQPADEKAQQDPLTADRVVPEMQTGAPQDQPAAPTQTPAAPQQPEASSFYADQTEQIRLQVAEHLEQGKMEFRMQLQPESLGKVDVRIALEGGKLAVEIAAASPKAAELLHRQAESLALALRAQGFDVESIQVHGEAQTEDSQNHNSQTMAGDQEQQGEDADDSAQNGPSFAQLEKEAAEKILEEQAMLTKAAR